MRADAEQNREKILSAAEEVFSREGISASTERVAQLAQVGIGSVFRHFPTKGDLLQAVLKRQIRGLTLKASQLLQEGDPGTALFDFLAHAFDVARTKSALSEAMPGESAGVSNSDIPEGRELRKTLSALLRRAQEAGRVRSDIGAEEVILLFQGVLRTAGSPPAEHAVWKRMTGVILDGLRTRGGRR